MLPIFRKLKVMIKAIAVALFTWGLLLVVTYYYRPADTWLEWNDLFFYTRFFKNPIGHDKDARHSDHAIDNLIIIDMVDPTENLSRQVYAELITLLTNAGAACIGLDIRFVEDKAWDNTGQQALAEAMGNHPRIILPFRLDREMQDESNEAYAQALDFIEEHFALPKEPSSSFSRCKKYDQHKPNHPGFYIEHPIPPLLYGTDYLGSISFDPDLYHLFPLVLGFNNRYYTSFAFEVARAYRESRGKSLEITSIPTTKHGNTLINYLPQENFDHRMRHEALSVLNTHPERFRDKIVLIVNSSPERPLVKTPLDRGEYPYWALHASLICQILDGQNIRAARSGKVLLPLALVLLGLIWLLFISERFSIKWRRMRWVLLFCNGFLALAAFLLLQADYWLSLVEPVIICTLGLTTVRYDIFRIYQLPKYNVFAIMVTEEQKGRYPVSITYSPVGEEDGNISFTRFFEHPNFQEHLDKLRNNNGTVNTLRTIGQSLCQAIFQAAISDRLGRSMDLANRNQERLRIQLRLDAPEISQLPWEYLCSDKLAVEFMALNRDISITRYIPFGAPVEMKEFRAPLRILAVIASPLDMPILNVENEKTSIMNSIKKSLANLFILRQVKVTFLEHATREKIAHEIADGKYDVLHFIGHSDFDEEKGVGALVLENADGNKEMVEAEEIGLMLHGSSIRLAVLNSCEGAQAPKNNIFFGVAQKIVRVGVPAVVAMQHQIFDDTAILFAKSFYYSLLAYYSIDAAVYDARKAIVKKLGISRQDWGTPVFFLRSGVAEIFETKWYEAIRVS